ncbi:MAG: membrane protein insertion efficiency factor YidD [bacterium]
MKHVGITAIKFYQTFISPLFPASCRFYPSSSENSCQSIQRYGFIKGVWMGAKRLSKCHPLHPGGYDPVK